MNAPSTPSLAVGPFVDRRHRLAAAMGQGVAIVATAPERTRNRDVHHPFRFDSYFYYLTGFTEPEAVLVLVATTRAVHAFRGQHFVASDKRTVVTGAEPAHRLVTELDAESAVEVYARLVGCSVGELTPMTFATHPLVVRLGGAEYVRSIQKVNEDESLTFFCAIDEGIVLTVARGVDLVHNLEETFAYVRARIGEPELVLGCDCLLRHIEIEQKDLVPQVSDILQQNGVIGFATYGEQYNAMHVNQTFTGVAIGAAGHV